MRDARLPDAREPPAYRDEARPARPLEDPGTRRVAIVRLRTGLGDLLCSVPALRARRAALPGATVTMVTWAEMEPVVERMRPYVDDLLPFPGYPGIPERPPRPELLTAFLAAARARSFDLAVQMYGAHPAANRVTTLLGARRTAGFFTPGQWDADLSTHLPYPFREHEIRRHALLVGFLGAGPVTEELEFPMRREDRRALAALLEETGLVGGRYACLHPGATAASRRWPPERFGAVGDALAARGLAVVVTGVRGEEAVTAAVTKAMSAPAVDFCGRTDLGAYAALLEECAVLVTNDTGAAQLAAALAVPSVTVFLSGDPVRWAGLDRSRHRVAVADVHCNPCGLQDCPIDFRCAWEVAPATVLREVDLLLDAALRRGGEVVHARRGEVGRVHERPPPELEHEKRPRP